MRPQVASPSRVGSPATHRHRQRRPFCGGRSVGGQGYDHPLAKQAGRAQAMGASGCVSSVSAQVPAVRRPLRHDHVLGMDESGRTAGTQVPASRDERHPGRMQGGHRWTPRRRRPPVDDSSCAHRRSSLGGTERRPVRERRGLGRPEAPTTRLALSSLPQSHGSLLRPAKSTFSGAPHTSVRWPWQWRPLAPA